MNDKANKVSIGVIILEIGTYVFLIFKSVRVLVFLFFNNIAVFQATTNRYLIRIHDKSLWI